jgi:hypothetical protein
MSCTLLQITITSLKELYFIDIYFIYLKCIITVFKYILRGINKETPARFFFHRVHIGVE